MIYFEAFENHNNIIILFMRKGFVDSKILLFENIGSMLDIEMWLAVTMILFIGKIKFRIH